ncbi:MAG: FAD-dependent oxidoreductase [Candidatus Omnitrophota bacterium]|jgi:ferredoxin-NADP reductase
MIKPVCARVIKVIPRTYNVKSIRAVVDGPMEFKAGQFLRIKLNNDENLQRYLSISNSPTENGYLEFTKKITDSDFSAAVSILKPGDIVSIEYPYGAFTLERAAERIAFISGGIGITPIRSMCKFAADKKLNLDIALLYANNSVRDIAFREDFDVMQKEYSNLRVIHVLCEKDMELSCVVGRINADIIKKEVPDYLERFFFLCGPPSMVEAMKGLLAKELGVPLGNIITENFQGYQ